MANNGTRRTNAGASPTRWRAARPRRSLWRATLSFWRIYAQLSDEERAFGWLEEACARPHHPYVPWIGSDVLLRSLFDDPRFVDLQRRMHLPDEALVGSS